MYDGSTALILAARLAVEGMVEELITCHADVNAVDELGKCVECFPDVISLFEMFLLHGHIPSTSDEFSLPLISFR